MELTIGANQFFWNVQRWAGFYRDLCAAPVDRVVLGELVCSKRLPFYQDCIAEAIDALDAAGKTVVMTSLAMITLKRERKMTAALAEMGVEVEVNDLTALAMLPDGVGFSVGPLVNVYNEGTLEWLAGRGARRVCLPPELPLASIGALADRAADLGVVIEVWGHGRVPLAISGRCYHARLHGRSKDNCQFACEDDPDGMPVHTTDDQPFLAVNGVQTLSHSFASMAHQIEALKSAGVGALRLSPQCGDFNALCQAYRDRLQGRLDAQGLVGAIQAPGQNLSDGFVQGARGADWSGDDMR